MDLSWLGLALACLLLRTSQNLLINSLGWAHPPGVLAAPCHQRVTSPAARLAQDHPGFHDPVYKQRRVDICNLARTHRM